MKYFALLTKLGENLLAQATALGTKLELTHMAVGDGGGKLPTPDTNQTKLIAEKRRAAINTLFIDDKNKNQIIAEQIIPEQDGGWWIREIGLFDKAGNLIAVANCPETYKPQLAEGSGRTQSIRIVLIVSHTESVTLKIDPSVVLATREYVNTEITVLDKKIDALSAQTKLDLNKKFDKANISSVLGNANDKVPSLNLLATELGKKQPKGDYAPAGYSYSKTESDGKYQPKGDYAPADDYATNAALNNGLNEKLDKTGGTVGGLTSTGNITSQGNVIQVSNSKNGQLIQLDATNDGMARINSRQKGGTTLNHAFPSSSGTLMNVGDYGVGSISPVLSNDELIKTTTNTYFRQGGGASNNAFTSHGAGLNNAYSKTIRSGYFIKHATTELYIYTSRDDVNAGALNIAKIYSDLNTQADHNGNVKIPGYLERSDYPVGCPVPWPQSTAPAGYLICNGQSFNKTTYPLLAKAYPSGKLPDLRSEFIRGLDYGRGVDANRTVLSSQLDAMEKIYGTTSTDSLNNTATGPYKIGIANGNQSGSSSGGSKILIFDSSISNRTANENRPRNIAFLYIVRAA
ncbi:phage tail-collar fiber domain-containing protein [Providencia sp. PROV060]|uniref:phage tail-collar fiber domain-containing protein n=1 Tax=Providencia sp. PROV060 TaxID=2949788 RepID=UPI0023498BAE|nr:phage tail protein [Providencia sp. PROV060]EJD6045566.1 phage tail protein [Providencia rettgeri]EJD6049635.1 phage tail protein [Providencia rettgeri]ELR5103437.1 phage tail protein [Providencia rettgeri]MDI7244470.1 phage tail protein [Providencia rettgeri]